VVDLYEIKSSTKVKPEHYPDLAFQVVVLESAGFKIRKIAIIHVNNEYVREGEVNFAKLSIATDVTNKVRKIIEETKKISGQNTILLWETLHTESIEGHLKE